MAERDLIDLETFLARDFGIKGNKLEPLELAAGSS